jgi:XTP/dITP diphosphohydrolase
VTGSPGAGAGGGAGRPILIASFNPGKAHELIALLSQSGRRATTLRDAGIEVPYEETGSTYEENGLGKARHYARLSGLVTIADDSGLEVEALGGAPGPLSARYGGPGLDDEERNRALLAALRGVPAADRGARYVAVAVVARPDGEARAFRGEVRGRLLEAPRGERGFGYDPLFFHEPSGATFAEVSDERKHAVSHRGAAFARLAEWLATAEGVRFVEEATW